ncbi:MAG TPA: 16S rRNA (cytosine(1402)-N(4))-methyltransferase RsmH [Firmicutes bacterium]|nr:16S rRNA (cytosine(1402)-N(4))-methyltransferase RsmH [Bacillota bacterium]
MDFVHQPVLLNEVIAGLNLKPNGIYVDCTLGGGGHTQAVLDSQPDVTVIGIDQDPNALAAAQARLAPYGSRVKYVRDNFRNLDRVLASVDHLHVDGILMDIGVSSPQLDQKDRGFSYQHDARLDMRMDPMAQISAHDLVNSLTKQELTRIIRDYGEERWANRIAEFIVEHRREKPIDTTGELVSVIKAAIPKKARLEGPHPAKRTFQALRIAVNDELGALSEAIEKAVNHLKPQGRLCVITFHSLEDRLVKNAFREFENPCICPPGLPICTCGKEPLVKIITRKPIAAGQEELAANPRARSAKLRVCERLP